jgi:methionyl-tRNA formyltransferase
MNSEIRVVFLGTPDYLNPIISALKENFNLVKTIRSPLEPLDEIKTICPDVIVVASFGKIIPGDILNSAKFGAINIHPSKLPLYRGPSPIQQQVLDGVEDSAISFILMDDKMDHGPLLHQEPFKIKGTDTLQSLLSSMFGESVRFLPGLIEKLIREKVIPQPQDDSKATYCSEIKKEDGHFDINNPPPKEILERMVRAYYPWPGVWTRWNGKIVKLLPEGKIQMEGKSATDLKSFLNGYRDFPLKEI